MKSYFLLLFVLILPMMGLAAPAQPQITCGNEMPTTTFVLKPAKADGKDINQLTVKHYIGAANAPIHNGVITAHDFEYLKFKAEIMAKLGDEFKINFDANKCENFGKDLWSCSNSEKQKINAVTVTGTNLVTRVIEAKIYEYTFKTYQVTFSFIYDSVMYDMPMIFSPEECLISNP